jgi:hypothetical protein
LGVSINIAPPQVLIDVIFVKVVLIREEEERSPYIQKIPGEKEIKKKKIIDKN